MKHAAALGWTLVTATAAKTSYKAGRLSTLCNSDTIWAIGGFRMHSPTSLILCYGGSFSPIHNGHLIVARHVAERGGYARIRLIPAR